MTAKFREIEYNAPAKQILAFPDHYVPMGVKHEKATASTPGLAVQNADGHYIVKAGTIYPSNDANAIGVVLNDYDVTFGAQNMAVVIHGFIQTSKLPVAPAAAAVAAMKDISFLPLAGLITVTGTADKVDVAVGATAAITDTASVTLANGLFRDEAATLSNWTFAGESGVKITVKSATVSADKKTVTFAFNTPSAAAVAGSITAKPAATVVDINKTYATALAILTVA